MGTLTTLRNGKQSQIWVNVLALTGFAVLFVFQIYAYLKILILSLGPRVILQPWLMQNGRVLYENIIDVHSPLMPIILSWLVPLIPDGFVLAKLVLVSLISITTLLVFVTGWRKINPLAGLWAAGFFVLWAPIFGFGKLWYETFLAPILIFWLLAFSPATVPRSVKTLVFFGISGGVVVLIKQPAALAFLALALWLVYTSWDHHRSISKAFGELVAIGLSALVPILVFLIVYYTKNGSLKNVYYWLIENHLAGGYKPVNAEYPTLRALWKIASCWILLPITAFLTFYLRRRGDHNWQMLGLGLVLVLTGSVTAYPRFEFFHLQAILPIVAFLSAMTLAYAIKYTRSKRYLGLIILLVSSTFFFVQASGYYHQSFRSERRAFVYEYTDLLPLAKQVRQEIGKKDCIYIFPDDEASANLYYLLRCKPPKFWILHYSWNLSETVRNKIVTSLEENPPKWVLKFPDFWDAEQAAPEVMSYIQEHYAQVAVLDWAQGEVKLLKRIR